MTRGCIYTSYRVIQIRYTTFKWKVTKSLSKVSYFITNQSRQGIRVRGRVVDWVSWVFYTHTYVFIHVVLLSSLTIIINIVLIRTYISEFQKFTNNTLIVREQDTQWLKEEELRKSTNKIVISRFTVLT